MACCPPFISTCSEIASKFEPRTLHQSNRWNSNGFLVFWTGGPTIGRNTVRYNRIRMVKSLFNWPPIDDIIIT